MQEILVLMGLPGCGKSTYAKQFIEDNPSYKRVNKDSIREMINFSVWTPMNEKLVVRIRNDIIHEFIQSGYNVIIDDTNLQVVHHDVFNDIAKYYDIGVSYKYFDVPIEECIRRDSERTGKARVGEDVIRRLWNSRTVDINKFIGGA